MVKFRRYEPIINRLSDDGLSIRDIHGKLREMFPEKQTPSVMTIQRYIEKRDETLSRFENKDKESILVEVNNSFDKLDREIKRAKESIYDKASITYSNKRILNREFEPVFNELESLRKDTEICIDRYYDFRRWFIRDFSR
ncbi:unnamed protein product, partial [marine sediment metagenome]